MHEIHTSERRSARGCRRRWNWAYREGYVPQETAKPLEFGIAFHEAMDVFFTPETWETNSTAEKLQAAIDVFTKTCDEQRSHYLEVTNQRELEVAAGDDYEERIKLGVGMLTHFANEIHPKANGWFKPIATEIPFEVQLFDENDNPLQCTNSPQCGQIHENHGDDSLVFFAGRVDMLVEDILNGGYFVWDHKTAYSLSPDDGFLQLDDQVGSYCWALGSVLGIDIRGFVYAEYRKGYPLPPEPLKRLSGGRSFSTGKAQATSLEVFQNHVKEFDADAYNNGCYDEFLTWLREEGPRYQQRFIIIKSDRELYEIGRNISLEAQDMTDPNLRIYPSVGRYGCANCAYRQPCVAQFQGEDYLYTLESLFTKVEHRYYHNQAIAKGDGPK